MIHYHGGPLGKASEAHEFFRGRHSCVSFQRREELEIIAEVSHSFIFDNGAFSVWKSGKSLDVWGYYEWVNDWRSHPSFDWALIPDVIEGSEIDNDAAILDWPWGFDGVPVWHLNESLERLDKLASFWPRIALGSTSGLEPNSNKFWARMADVMGVVCDERGRPRCKLHGLRMLNPQIFAIIPMSSADSTGCVMNAFMNDDAFGMYVPKKRSQRANIIADRIESHNSSPIWNESNSLTRQRSLL